MNYKEEKIGYDQLELKSKKTVIIAETDLSAASEITNCLSSLGYQIFPVVLRGEELIEQVLSLKPSLIITDINLNGQLDGVEAIARLEETENINYIFITAYDDYSRLINSYYLNPIGIIKKPLKFDDIIKSLSKTDLEFV